MDDTSTCQLNASKQSHWISREAGHMEELQKEASQKIQRRVDEIILRRHVVFVSTVTETGLLTAPPASTTLKLTTV